MPFAVSQALWSTATVSIKHYGWNTLHQISHAKHLRHTLNHPDVTLKLVFFFNDIGCFGEKFNHFNSLVLIGNMSEILSPRSNAINVLHSLCSSTTRDVVHYRCDTLNQILTWNIHAMLSTVGHYDCVRFFENVLGIPYAIKEHR